MRSQLNTAIGAGGFSSPATVLPNPTASASTFTTVTNAATSLSTGSSIVAEWRGVEVAWCGRLDWWNLLLSLGNEV